MGDVATSTLACPLIPVASEGGRTYADVGVEAGCRLLVGVLDPEACRVAQEGDAVSDEAGEGGAAGAVWAQCWETRWGEASRLAANWAWEDRAKWALTTE